ncbi:hypothetical protein N779_03390 [Vibrio coralliilyticus OCN008]|nr:hypothetical protein N779_03390 [Vibrio coralliilyticus OCN008]
MNGLHFKFTKVIDLGYMSHKMDEILLLLIS